MGFQGEGTRPGYYFGRILFKHTGSVDYVLLPCWVLLISVVSHIQRPLPQSRESYAEGSRNRCRCLGWKFPRSFFHIPVSYLPGLLRILRIPLAWWEAPALRKIPEARDSTTLLLVHTCRPKVSALLEHGVYSWGTLNTVTFYSLPVFTN